MANNVVSATLTSNSNAFKINTMSANKNIVNPELMEHLIYKQEQQEGISSNDISPDLMVHSEYTLEELLAEGKETWQEMKDIREAERLRKEAEERAKAEALAKAQAEEAARIRQQKLDELEDLRAQLEANNGIFHPKIEAELEKKIKALEDELNVGHQADGWEKFVSTAAVVTTTVVSGAADIVEGAADGVIWVSGTIVAGTADLLGEEEFANKVKESTMDAIAVDVVGELNKEFYENTEIGRSINDASAMKYDSEEAQFIRDASKEIIIIAGATAATVATGGAAAPLFAAGFAMGAGESAEEKFKDVENRNFYGDALEIGLDGTIRGLSTMAYGKAGAAAFNGVKSLASNGLKTTVKETLSAFNKDVIKSTIKTSGRTIAKNTAVETLKDKDTWLETGTVWLDNIKSGVQTGELNITEMLCEAALIYGENYIGNLAGFYQIQLRR